MEQLYEGRLKGVTKQLETSTTKNKEYEKMVKHMRKKSTADREELVKVRFKKLIVCLFFVIFFPVINKRNVNQFILFIFYFLACRQKMK